MAWTPHLLAIFEHLKQVITLSPLLTRYDNTKPRFLKIDWGSTGIGYNLMQPDDSTGSVTSTSKLRKSGELNFDLASTAQD